MRKPVRILEFTVGHNHYMQELVISGSISHVEMKLPYSDMRSRFFCLSVTLC